MPDIMYTDMSEREFIKWNLAYTIPLVAASIKSIPEAHLWVRPAPFLDPPGWILGCCVTTENKVISGLRKRTTELPAGYGIFTGCPTLTTSITEGQLAELGTLQLSLDTLLSTCKRVREATNAYLDSLEDGQLKEIPDRGGIDDYDPLREEFVKLIWTQNFVLGKLLTIAQLTASDAERVERPGFSAASRVWDAIQI